jgi:hypothetical protein
MMGAPLFLAVVLPLGAGGGDAIFADDFGAGACPPGRIERSDLEYFDGTVADVDMTSFDEIWGRWGSNYQPEPFPAGSSAPRIMEFPLTGYVAALASIAPETPDYYTGRFYYTDTNPNNPRIDFSISPRCGDFSPSLELCVVYDALPTDTPMVGWSFVEGEFSECVLERGRNYYINLRFSDPMTPSPECVNDICSVRTASSVALP